MKRPTAATCDDDALASKDLLTPNVSRIKELNLTCTTNRTNRILASICTFYFQYNSGLNFTVVLRVAICSIQLEKNNRPLCILFSRGYFIDLKLPCNIVFLSLFKRNSSFTFT